jgi:hypothetical protein
MIQLYGLSTKLSNCFINNPALLNMYGPPPKTGAASLVGAACDVVQQDVPVFWTPGWQADDTPGNNADNTDAPRRVGEEFELVTWTIEMDEDTDPPQRTRIETTDSTIVPALFTRPSLYMEYQQAPSGISQTDDSLSRQWVTSTSITVSQRDTAIYGLMQIIADTQSVSTSTSPPPADPGSMLSNFLGLGSGSGSADGNGDSSSSSSAGKTHFVCMEMSITDFTGAPRVFLQRRPALGC